MDYPKHRTIVNFDDTSIAFARLSTPKLRKTYAIFALMNQNSLVKVGTFFIKFALDKGLPIKKMIKNTIFGIGLSAELNYSLTFVGGDPFQ